MLTHGRCRGTALGLLLVGETLRRCIVVEIQRERVMGEDFGGSGLTPSVNGVVYEAAEHLHRRKVHLWKGM
jgi:hypothetical protein